MAVKTRKNNNNNSSSRKRHNKNKRLTAKRRVTRRGGSVPFVGKPWGPQPFEWPGVDSSRNYYSLNEYYNDPKMMIVGGKNKNKKRKYTRKKNRGGTLIPQDLINLNRSVMFEANSMYNTLRGVDAPINPLPYKDQL